MFTAVVGDVKFCESHEDCDESQCCLRPFLYASAICQPLLKEGKFCLPERISLEKDISFMSCSCQPGLKCIAEKVVEDEELKTYHKPECKKDE